MMKPKKCVAVIGPSTRFLSGISYYTIMLSNTLSCHCDVVAILFRHMLPRKMFPGWKRVGNVITRETFLQDVKVREVMDWYNPFSFLKAYYLLRGCDVAILQWWTASVAHMYFIIQLLNFRRIPVIIEFHEVSDPFEQSVLPLRAYTKIMGRMIRSLSHEYVVHSSSDRELISRNFGIQKEKISVIPIGLYDQYLMVPKDEARSRMNIREEHVILFFGLIRPYKGLSYLIDAFERLPADIRKRSRLMIVGEAWEDPESITRAKKSKYAENITVISRYVGDDEVSDLFSAADVLVIPYTRASQSAVAHIGMAYGLPVIASYVGGLTEGLSIYSGTLFVPPCNPEKIALKIADCLEQKQKYTVPEDLRWMSIGNKWKELIEKLK